MNDDVVLKKKKRLLHPTNAFILLSVLVIVISGIASFFGLQATYTKINPITGELQPYLVTVDSLFNADGIRFIFSNVTKIFVSFAPLAMSLIFLIGLGVAEKSGFLKTFITKTTAKIPKKTVTFLVILLGVLANITNEMVYVMLIPLGALIFLFNNRNPLVGIIASFVGASFGFGINALIGTLNISLGAYTNMAARIVDAKHQTGISADWFLMVVATLLIAWIGTVVTEKIIVPRVGKYVLDTDIYEDNEQGNKKRGMLYALMATIVLLVILGYMIIPGLPYSGILLDQNEIGYARQLFGLNSYFQEGLPFILTMLFFVAGLFYGIGSKTFKNNKDISNAMSNYSGVVANIVVMIFFASMFIAFFKKTNIGTIIATLGADVIKNIGFSGIPLIIVTLIVVTIISLFITSPTIKWAIISPIIVPTLMQSNITPEFSQVILKAGHSIANGVTPLMAYFVIFLAFLNYYNPNKNVPITIKKAVSLTIPYSIAYALLWILLLLGWYIIGLPIGPGVYPTI